jgi:uncharacterized protein (DUF58 family)
MEATRYYLGEMALVAVLAGLAVLAARPLLLVGAAGVGGWALARQYEFVRGVSALASELSVSQSLDRQRVMVGDETRLVLDARADGDEGGGTDGDESEDTDGDGIDDSEGERVGDGVPLDVEVAADAPVGVEGEPTRVSLSVGEGRATASSTVESRLAGEFGFAPATATASGRSGRFAVSFPTGSGPTLTVDPRGPRNLHVGAGGENLSAPYGDYQTGDRGSGLEMAELRPYVPSDSASKIDWNATARFDEAYVREYETDSERGTAIVLDCRPSMATGEEGETKFEYARQVALEVARRSRRNDERVVLYAVGEDGLLARPADRASGYGSEAVERRLRSLEPESSAARGDGGRDGDGVHAPGEAIQLAYRLADDDSAYADRLRPFFADADPYVERLEGDPLYAAVRTHLERLPGQFLTVVLTDDRAPTETREVVKLASRDSDAVMAFLTPSVLFDGETADASRAFGRYADFEEFRRELARLDGVSAYEVGPGDRIERLLAANAARQGRVES